MSDKLSEIEGVRQWQVRGYTEEIATRLYNLTDEYSVELSKLDIDYVTSSLMKILSDVFIIKRDVEIFLNSTSNDINPKLMIPKLKKRIKYCRNPLEKKKLQQELNQVYKEQKKRGNNILEI